MVLERARGARLTATGDANAESALSSEWIRLELRSEFRELRKVKTVHHS